MQPALRIDELEAIIARILGLEARYEVRLCRRGLLGRAGAEVPNHLVVTWRDVSFARLGTVGDLDRAVRRRYGIQCRILDADKTALAAKTRLRDLRPGGLQGGPWQRLVSLFA